MTTGFICLFILTCIIVALSFYVRWWRARDQAWSDAAQSLKGMRDASRRAGVDFRPTATVARNIFGSKSDSIFSADRDGGWS